MKYGARKGTWNFLKRWAAKAMAHELYVFPVPGSDVLRSYGLHLEKKGINIAATPREASVLLLVGPVSEILAEKAAMAYAQIPRPRVLVFAGLDKADPLPEPDIKLSLQAENLQEEIKKLLTQHAWRKETEPFATEKIKEAVEDKDEDHGHMHHGHEGEQDEEHGEEEEHQEHHQKQGEHEHGNAHQQNEQNKKHASHQHNQEHTHQEHDGHEHHKKNNDGDEQDEHQQEENEDHDHEEHEHQHGGGGGHNHGGGGFMSMVAMTKDMPRSMDGLAMEMNPVHFGPFFPGLPGGLSISMMLDGDTVMQAELEKGLLCRNLMETFPSEPKAFVGHIATINPLAPVAFRILAEKAVANALKMEDDEQKGINDLVLLEKERILSHLNWLAVFSQTIGSPVMHLKAIDLHRQYQRGRDNEQAILKLIKQIRKSSHLKMRLKPVGMIPKNLLHHASGSIARAGGVTHDARMQDKTYENFSFSPLQGKHNNAWGKLLMRLAEIEQSLKLIQANEKLSVTGHEKAIPYNESSGEGRARVETPRGVAEMTVQISAGQVKKFHLTTPSASHAAFIPEVAKGQELGDALIGIASLDIAPWEIDL
jgi:Ni,Fe-hydrogenase III large subunit